MIRWSAGFFFGLFKPSSAGSGVNGTGGGRLRRFVGGGGIAHCLSLSVILVPAAGSHFELGEKIVVRIV